MYYHTQRLKWADNFGTGQVPALWSWSESYHPRRCIQFMSLISFSLRLGFLSHDMRISETSLRWPPPWNRKVWNSIGVKWPMRSLMLSWHRISLFSQVTAACRYSWCFFHRWEERVPRVLASAILKGGSPRSSDYRDSSMCQCLWVSFVSMSFRTCADCGGSRLAELRVEPMASASMATLRHCVMWLSSENLSSTKMDVSTSKLISLGICSGERNADPVSHSETWRFLLHPHWMFTADWWLCAVIEWTMFASVVTHSRPRWKDRSEWEAGGRAPWAVTWMHPIP